MARPKKPEEPPKINLEVDMYPHIIQRIDHYLYKRWPDLFVDENFKQFKNNYENKYNEMIGKEARIEARLQEFEGKIMRMVKEYNNSLNDMIDRQSAKLDAEIFARTAKRWWQFWK